MRQIRQMILFIKKKKKHKQKIESFAQEKEGDWYSRPVGVLRVLFCWALESLSVLMLY